MSLRECRGSLAIVTVALLVVFASAQTTKVGFFYDGLLDDGGFLSSANAGVTQLKNKYPTQVEVGFNGPAEGMDFIGLLTQGSNFPFPTAFTAYDIIFCVGFEFNAPVSGWAKQFPNIKFILIDDVISPPLANVVSVIFAENEAGFIAGAAAGIVSKTKTVAMLGGIEISPVRKYITGFDYGIQTTCPECKVIVKYIGGFGLPDVGKALAIDVITNFNADIIFPVAGGSGASVITDIPALYPNVRTIGVDTDSYLTILGSNQTSPGAAGLLFSVGKSVTNAAFQTLDQFVSTKVFTSGTKVLTFASKGIQIFPCHNLCNEFNPATDSTIQGLISQLTSQEISSGVSNLDGVPNSLRDTTLLNSWQQFKPAYRPADAIDKLMTTLTVDSFGTQVQILTAGSSGESWIWSPTQLVWERIADGPTASKAAIGGYNEVALVYGGDGTTASATADFWQFNYTTRAWVLLNTTGGPGALQQHSGAVWKSKFLVFGGTNEQSQLRNQLWAYDVVDGTWTQLTGKFADGSEPVARNLHTAVVIGDVMYVYGGQDSQFKTLGDLSGYDLVSNQWFLPNATTETLPRLRSHAAVAIANSMVVVGGADSANNKPAYTIRIDLPRFAARVAVTVNVSLPNVGQAVSACPGNGTTTGGLSLAAIAVQQTGADTGNVWVFGGSNANAVRQSTMLFNNFNITLDTLGAKRTLKFIEWKDGVVIAINVITALLMLLAVVVGGVLAFYFNTPVVVYSNRVSIFVSLFAILMLYAVVFTYPDDLSKAQCGIRMWFLGLGLMVLLGPMISKLYRLYRILENTSLVQTAISNRDIAIYSGIVIAIEVVLLIIWTGVDRLKPKIVNAQNSDESVIICACKHFWAYMGIQLAFIGVIVIAGIYFSIRVRNVSGRVLWGDATYISYAFYVIAVAVVLLSLISAFLYKFYLGGYVALMVVYLISVTMVFALLFWVKVYVIFFKKAQNQSTGSMTGSADISTEFKPPEDFDNPI